MTEKTAKATSHTLSKREILTATADRLSEIQKEFTEGFKFLSKHPKSVTFFGGSQVKDGSPDYEEARTLASRIAKELDYAVISGGGPGIMEAANRGAKEAGGRSLGLLIKLPHAQPTNQYITDEISFYYFFVRKVCLTFSAEAFIFFPGGFGTLDEFFEILTLVQTKKIEGVPLICVGSEYWLSVKDFIEKEIDKRGFIAEGDKNLFAIVDSHDEIIELIKNSPVRNGLLFNGHDQIS